MVNFQRKANDNETAIKVANFGGLNSESSPMAMPFEDSPYLLNVDIDITGKVSKRRGTRLVWEESSTSKMSLAEFTTSLGYPFVVSKVDNSLRVFELSNDVATKVWEATNVFRDTTVLPQSVLLPGPRPKLLMLTPGHAPIQLNVVERRVLNYTGSAPQFSDAVEFASLFAASIVYVNGTRVSTSSITYSTGVVTANLTDSVSNATVEILCFSWQWWAEALTWFGEDFFRGLSRFGATQNDQHTQIPDSLQTDNDNEYLITLYKSTAWNDKYTEATNQQPRNASEFSFSDGVNYTYDSSKFVTKSPLFVTFGRENNQNTTTFTDYDIDYPNSVITIVNHEFQMYDAITVNTSNGKVPSGVTAGTTYYVKVLDKDRFELYTTIALSVKITFTDRGVRTFNDTLVNVELDSINISGHGFTSGNQVNAYSTKVLPSGMATTVTYYVGVIDSNNIELYFDEERTRRVNLISRSFRAITLPGDLDDANDRFTTSSHLLFDGVGIRFNAGAGTIPTGLTGGTLYYAKIITANQFEVYSDSALTTKVNFTGGSGTIFWYEDGGTHSVKEFSGNLFIERPAFDQAYFSRRRRLRFNANKGITPSKLDVRMDDVTMTRSTTIGSGNATYGAYYTYESSASTVSTSGSNVLQYLSFDAATRIGLDRASIIKMVNKEAKWVGSSAVESKYEVGNYGNGRYIEAFGLGLYADYDTGRFPQVGAVFQGRLVLGGFENDDLTVIFSAVSDSVFADQFFNYYQITDGLNTPDSDPFDLIVPAPASDAVRALLNYQNSLFIFTQESVYRTFSQNVIVNGTNRALGLVASQGVCNSNCVVSTDSTVYYLSRTGLFNLDILQQEKYLAAEVSIKLRSKFKSLLVIGYQSLPWLAYDKTKNRIFVALPEKPDATRCQRIYVFDTTINVWTEYRALSNFLSYAGLSYQDRVLGQLVMITNKLQCANAFTRFDYSKQGDFIKRITGVAEPIDGIPPIFWSTQTTAGVYEYKPNIAIIPITNVQDLIVKYGPTIDSTSPLTYDVDWVKDKNGYLRLTFNPTTGYYLIVESVVSNGTSSILLWKNNVLSTWVPLVSFKNRTYSDICTAVATSCPTLTGLGSSIGYEMPVGTHSFEIETTFTYAGTGVISVHKWSTPPADDMVGAVLVTTLTISTPFTPQAFPLTVTAPYIYYTFRSVNSDFDYPGSPAQDFITTGYSDTGTACMIDLGSFRYYGGGT
jgi:hypothetical protein